MRKSSKNPTLKEEKSYFGEDIEKKTKEHY